MKGRALRCLQLEPATYCKRTQDKAREKSVDWPIVDCRRIDSLIRFLTRLYYIALGRIARTKQNATMPSPSSESNRRRSSHIVKVKEEDGSERSLLAGVPDHTRCDNTLITSKYTILNFLPKVSISRNAAQHFLFAVCCDFSRLI